MAPKAKRAVPKKKRGKVIEEPPVAQPEPTDVPEAPAVVQEYAACACGARLVLPHEIDAKQCETCSGAREHLADDETVYPTAEAANAASLAAAGVDAETAARVNVAVAELRAQYQRIETLNAGIEETWKQNTEADRAKRKTLAEEAAHLEDAYDTAWEKFAATLEDSPLDADDLRSQVESGTWTPIPGPAFNNGEPAAVSEQPAPADPFQPSLPGIRPPFDFKAALEDLCAKQRLIDAQRKTWKEQHEKAADLKKQIDAAVDTLAKAIAEYDAARREAEAEAIRQEKLLAAYEQKAAEEAAAQGAEPEPEPDFARHGMADFAVAPPSVETPIADALPTCACGLALALDEEKARGTCYECHDQAEQKAAGIAIPIC